ncbi:MAG: glycosyltransferase [Saprospiraceae bacterium]
MTRKIRVAFFADILVKNFDGASRTMFQLIERIPNDKYEFKFFCGLEPIKDIGHEVVKVPTVPIPFNSTYKLALPFFKLSKLKSTLANFSPDVIHIASPSPLGDYAMKYGKKKNIPVITIYHTHFISYMDYYLRLLPFFVKPIKKAVAYGQRKFYVKADLMYIPTMQMVKELSDNNFSKTNMKIWKRGIDHSLFNPSNKDDTYMHSITGNAKPNIIFASRLVWEKNLATLIKLYKLSKEDGDKYNFIIAGDGIAKVKLSE